jgi:hypothetical protein
MAQTQAQKIAGLVYLQPGDFYAVHFILAVRASEKAPQTDLV